MTARLVLSLADLAPLVGDETRLGICHPWHDETLDRDVVTNGQAILTWAGHQFTALPGHADPPGDVLRAYLEPMPPVGKATLWSLRLWCDDERDNCPTCSGDTVLRCTTCGELVEPDRPGLFGGRILNRRLMARYLRALPGGDDAVEVRMGGNLEGPVQLVAALWTLVIMPMRRDTKPAGEPFALTWGAS